MLVPSVPSIRTVLTNGRLYPTNQYSENSYYMHPSVLEALQKLDERFGIVSGPTPPSNLIPSGMKQYAYATTRRRAYTKGAYKGKKRNYGKKRQFSSRIKNRGQTVRVIQPRGMASTPLPSRYLATFECEIVGSLNSGAPSFGPYDLNGNGPWIPFSGGGWPAVLTSSIATLNCTNLSTLLNNSNTGIYNNFRVFASSIEIELVPGSAVDGLVLVVVPTIGSTYAASAAAALGMPFSKNMLVNASNGSTKLTHYMTTAEMYGVPASAVRDDVSGVFSGKTTALPTSAWNWYMFAATTDAQNTAANCHYKVCVKYYTELYNLNTERAVQT